MWSLRRSLQKHSETAKIIGCALGGAAGIGGLVLLDEDEETVDEFALEQENLSALWSPPRLDTYCDGAFLLPPSSLHDQQRHRPPASLVLKRNAKHSTIESKYTIDWEKPLGQGAYGAVYRAVGRKTGNSVAVKQIHKRFTDEDSFQREMDSLMLVKDHGGHPNLVRMRENFDQGDHFYIVLDLVEGQEVFQALCSKGPFSEADAARHIRETASALSFLHALGVVHCDLKPENLMLSSKDACSAVVKIIDLGCAHINRIGISSGLRGKTVTTPAYSPPEFLRGLRKDGNPLIDPSFDSWSLGVILYTMLVGLHPFDPTSQATDEGMEQRILSGEKPPLRDFPFAKHLSKDAMDLIEGLMEQDPAKRLSTEQVLANRWVRGETASSRKIVGSDKRLALYRKYQTQIGSAFFRKLLSHNDSIQSSDTTSESVSIMESAFNRLDKNQNGFLTTSDMCEDGHGGEKTKLSLSDVTDILAKDMKNRYFAKNRMVYHSRNSGDSMYIINSGSVEVTSPCGVQTVRRAGEIFGEETMAGTADVYVNTVKCLTPVHALEIPRELYAKYVLADEEAFLSMAETRRYHRRVRAKTVVSRNQEFKSRSLKKNETIFREGDRGGNFYIVAKGEVDISAKGHVVRSLRVGEVTGEHAAYFDKPYNVTARCVSDDSCDVKALSYRSLQKIFRSDPSLRSDFRDLTLRRDFKKALCFSIGGNFPTSENEIRSAFDSIDHDKSGEITLSQLRDMVHKFDPDYDEKYIRDMLESLDLNNSGSLTWAEFHRILSMDKES